MNLLAGFVGFSAFTVTCLVIGLFGYWQAERIEGFARAYTRKSKAKSVSKDSQ